MAAVCAAGGALGVRAQETSELITTALPFPQYYYVQDDHYGHRIGNVKMHYGASLTGSFTDNRNLTSENQQSDYGVNSMVNLGGFYQINERQKLQIDVGIGYGWWLESSDRDGLSISPSSHIDYYFDLGGVRVNMANSTGTSASAADRYEYSGGDGTTGNKDLAFHELSNTTTASASWAVNRVMSVNGSYAFTLTRSLNDQFQQLDSNNHAFRVGPSWQVTAPLSLGLYGSYSMTTYEQRVQNDGKTVSAGMTLGWKPMDNLTVTFTGGWTHSFYEQTGTIQDDSEYNKPTFSLSITHRINKSMTQTVSSSQGASSGYESNFTDSFNVSYLLAVQYRRISPVLTFSYTDFAQSGSTGDQGSSYRIGLSAGYQLLRSLNLGLSYGVNIRDTEGTVRDYVENTVSVNLNYTF